MSEPIIVLNRLVFRRYECMVTRLTGQEFSCEVCQTLLRSILHASVCLQFVFIVICVDLFLVVSAKQSIGVRVEDLQ